MIEKYKDPYETTRISWKVVRFFFLRTIIGLGEAKIS